VVKPKPDRTGTGPTRVSEKRSRAAYKWLTNSETRPKRAARLRQNASRAAYIDALFNGAFGAE